MPGEARGRGQTEPVFCAPRNTVRRTLPFAGEVGGVRGGMSRGLRVRYCSDLGAFMGRVVDV